MRQTTAIRLGAVAVLRSRVALIALAVAVGGGFPFFTHVAAIGGSSGWAPLDPARLVPQFQRTTAYPARSILGAAATSRALARQSGGLAVDAFVRGANGVVAQPTAPAALPLTVPSGAQLNADAPLPVTFSDKADYGFGSTPQSVTTGDFNGDGELDLAVASWSTATVSVRLGTGLGIFGDAHDYATGSGSFSVTTGDFNGDGKPDLAVANYASNTLSVLIGDGTGSFAAKVDYVAGAAPYSVTTGDFNGDGKLDLVVANYGSDTVSVLLNTTVPGTPVTFAPKADFATGALPISVTTGDFNADGKLDLAVANYGSNTMSVLRNTTVAGTAVTFAAKADSSTGNLPLSVTAGPRGRQHERRRRERVSEHDRRGRWPSHVRA